MTGSLARTRKSEGERRLLLTMIIPSNADCIWEDHERLISSPSLHLSLGRPLQVERRPRLPLTTSRVLYICFSCASSDVVRVIICIVFRILSVRGVWSACMALQLHSCFYETTRTQGFFLSSSIIGQRSALLSARGTSLWPFYFA